MMAVCPYADTNICVFHKMCNAKCEMPKKAICLKKRVPRCRGTLFFADVLSVFKNDFFHPDGLGCA